MGAVGEGETHAWAHCGDWSGRGVCRTRGPTLSEPETGEPGTEGAARLSSRRRGQSVRPLRPLPAMENIAITLPPSPDNLHSTPSSRASPGTWVKGSGTPVTRWPLLPSLESNFRRGPRRGVPEKEALPRWFGEGAGRPVLGRGGGGPAGGRCPGGPGPGRGGAPSPGPGAIRKARRLAPGLKSLRVHDAPEPTEEAESDPSPNRRG